MGIFDRFKKKNTIPKNKISEGEKIHDKNETKHIHQEVKGPKESNKKRRFLAGWEVRLDNEEHCQSFFETQITSQETALSFYSHIELEYDENGVLERAITKDEDGNEKELIIHNEIKLKDYRINSIINFYIDDNGLNQLGGKSPYNFKIPSNDCPGSFQYLGRISNQSIGYEWLPFELNLISPIYMDMDKIWLDYSNPHEPVVLNLEEVNSLSTAYDDLKSDSFIEYKKQAFVTIEETSIVFDKVHSGIPNWTQFSDIPRCPKTNKTMRFLCQIQSGAVKTEKSNIVPKDSFYNSYFDNMDFWGGGDMYVFFEPESKIACYFIQNT